MRRQNTAYITYVVTALRQVHILASKGTLNSIIFIFLYKIEAFLWAECIILVTLCIPSPLETTQWAEILAASTSSVSQRAYFTFIQLLEVLAHANYKNVLCVMLETYCISDLYINVQSFVFEHAKHILSNSIIV